MTQVQRILIPALAIAVTASLAISAGKLFWHAAGETAALPADITIAATLPTLATEPVDIGPAIELAPFGSAVQTALATQSAEATTLDLALRGILLQSDPAQSFALIATDGTTLRYALGDPIGTKATLLEIEDRHVVLDVGGVRQILGFPNVDVSGSLAEPSSETLDDQGNLDRLRAALEIGTGSIEIKDPPPPQSTEDYIGMWRARINRNPNQVLDEIGLIATEKGYMVDENHDAGVKLAGLKAGDRVASVNGQPVGNVEQDRKFLEDVAASGVARLEVFRGDKTFVLSFPLR